MSPVPVSDASNDAVLAALDRTGVRLVGVRPAGEVTQGLGRRRYLHAGPPIALDEMVGPMRAALAGALVLEGEASDLAGAEAIIAAGEVAISPCHDAGGVGAMAGIVSPSTAVVLVEAGTGRRAFAPLNEGLGKALRYGNNDAETLAALRRLSGEIGPLLDAAIAALPEPIDMVALQAEALRRGDECHNRNVAASSALLLRLAPGLITAARDKAEAAAALGWLAANPQLFLSFSMATAKAIAAEAHATGAGSIVTAIASNGRETAIRVSGAGARWFAAPAPIGRPKFKPGFGLEDACASMGDSPVTETTGLGALAFSAAPALAELFGEDPRRAGGFVAEMRRICVGASSRYLIPAEGYAGTPLGIEVHAVVRHGIMPGFSNGLSHREAGVGVIGAALTRVPLACFEAASSYLAAGASGGRT